MGGSARSLATGTAPPSPLPGLQLPGVPSPLGDSQQSWGWMVTEADSPENWGRWGRQSWAPPGLGSSWSGGSWGSILLRLPWGEAGPAHPTDRSRQGSEPRRLHASLHPRTRRALGPSRLLPLLLPHPSWALALPGHQRGLLMRGRRIAGPSVRMSSESQLRTSRRGRALPCLSTSPPCPRVHCGTVPRLSPGPCAEKRLETKELSGAPGGAGPTS